MSSPSLPSGFAPLDLSSGFVRMAGPMYGRRRPGGIDIGFRVEERHCNLWDNCHGGWLSTLADVQLAIACKTYLEAETHASIAQERKPPLLVTMNLTVDFLAPAALGAWVEGDAQVLGSGSRTAFAQMTASADGVLCLRASATFKL